MRRQLPLREKKRWMKTEGKLISRGRKDLILLGGSHKTVGQNVVP